jgi:hypothetical protein
MSDPENANCWAEEHRPRPLFPEDPQRISLNVFNTSPHPPKAFTDGMEFDTSVGQILLRFEQRAVIEAVAYNGGVLDVRLRGEEGWITARTASVEGSGGSGQPEAIRLVVYNRDSRTEPEWARWEETDTVARVVGGLEERAYVLSLAYCAGEMNAVVLGHTDGWDQRQ